MLEAAACPDHPRAVRRRRTLGFVGLPFAVSSPKRSFSQTVAWRASSALQGHHVHAGQQRCRSYLVEEQGDFVVAVDAVAG